MSGFDVAKVTKGDITQFAKRLAKFNTMITNAICLAEELVHDPMIREFDEYEDEHKEYIVKLAKAFKRIKKYDNEFINIEEHSAYFQEWDSFTDVLSRAIDELD